MKKLNLILGFLMIASLVASPLYAQNVRATFGNKVSGVYALEEKSDDIVYVRPSGGIKYSYEKATTSDTITIGECGTTYAVAPTSDATFTLPTAEVGCGFTFVAVDGHGDGSKDIIVDVQSGDTIRGVFNSGSDTQLAAGDSTKSPGVTGDSITVFSSELLYWDVVDRTGAWTDNN